MTIPAGAIILHVIIQIKHGELLRLVVTPYGVYFQTIRQIYFDIIISLDKTRINIMIELSLTTLTGCFMKHPVFPARPTIADE